MVRQRLKGDVREGNRPHRGSGLGGTPVGSPLVGVDDQWVPRSSVWMICRSTDTCRRSMFKLEVVTPKHSPWRRPDPAARAIIARYRSGAASISAYTSEGSNGLISFGSGLGGSIS